MNKICKVVSRSIIFTISFIMLVITVLGMFGVSFSSALVTDKSLFMATNIINWIVLVPTIFIAVMIFILTFINDERMEKVADILTTVVIGLILVLIITIICSAVALLEQFPKLIMSETISASDELALSTMLNVIVMTAAIIGSLFLIAIYGTCFRTYSKSDKKTTQHSTETSLVDVNSPELMAQTILMKKIKEAEEKLKTKELEDKYNEVMKQLNVSETKNKK